MTPIPTDLQERFEFQNYGHALEILTDSFPEEWGEVQECLRRLLNRQLNNADLIKDLKAVLLAAARQPQNMANITPAII